MSILDGVVAGVGRVEDGTPGVGGEVAEGIMYESLISMRSRVMLAMMGWRLEFWLMVLKVNFRSSAVEVWVALDVEGWRRRCGGFATQRDLRVRP